MRFELALVVGIIFFCCWCAYIIIKMDSSLSVQQQQEPQPTTQQQHQQEQINNRTLVYGTTPDGRHQLRSDHYFASQSQPSPARYANSNNNQQLQRLPVAAQASGAYYPNLGATSRGSTVAALPRGKPVAADLDYGSAAAAAAAAADKMKARAGARPSHSRGVAAEGRQLEAGPEEQAGLEADEDDSAAEGEGEPNDQVEANSPGTRRESETIEAGRSFSQNEADATERDRFGNPVRAYRRHLINGKPVLLQPAAAAAAPIPQDGADFDKVVDEIEGDDQSQAEDEQTEDDDQPQQTEEQEQEQPQQPEGSESRLSAKLTPGKPNQAMKPRERRLQQHFGAPQLEEIDEHSGDKLLPANAKDLHQHRLKESLQAQQWDDDTATASPSGQPETNDSNESNQLVEDQRPDQDQTEELERADIAFKDLDLLSEGRFPFLENGGGASEDQEQQPVDEEEEESADEQTSRRAKRSLTELIRVVGGSADNRQQQQQQLPLPLPDKGWLSTNSSLLDQASRRQSTASADNEPSPTNNLQAPQNRGTNETSHGSADNVGKKGLARLELDQNDQSANVSRELANDDTIDVVLGQEDLSIEVLTDPPTLMSSSNNNNDDDGAPSSYPDTKAWPASNGHSAGPVDHEPSRGPAVASGAPQVGLFDAANGGQTTSDTKPKGEKRKKTKSSNVKKSQAHDSKYRAAKVAAMKRKAKLKKGGLAKRRKKQGKKYAKSHKEFRGSTRGKKGAKGVGRRGAKKGALFYKDKGYKKRGFKKAYQKLESGDHKTYFDEFRDKDHNKKWKDFKDKHHYSHGKKWAANDRKRYKNMSAKELRDKNYGLGKWHQRENSKYRKEYGKKSKSSSMKKKQRRKKSKAKKQKDYHS